MSFEREPQAPRTLRRARRLGEPRPPVVGAADAPGDATRARLARHIRAHLARYRAPARGLCAALLFALAFLPALPARGPVASPGLLAALGVADEITRRLEGMNPHLRASRVARIREAVLRSSERHGLDPLLVTAIIEVESNFRPEARSPLGALGLMQVMPHMFRVVHVCGESDDARIEH